jgi:UDP-N-acetyl-D-mannosaminuronic acid dehydrogenase
MQKPDSVVKHFCEAADQFKKPVIACLGLAFKADIDDLRESPAVDIALKLAQPNIGKVLAVEPNVTSGDPENSL